MPVRTTHRSDCGPETTEFLAQQFTDSFEGKAKGPQPRNQQFDRRQSIVDIRRYAGIASVMQTKDRAGNGPLGEMSRDPGSIPNPVIPDRCPGNVLQTETALRSSHAAPAQSIRSTHQPGRYACSAQDRFLRFSKLAVYRLCAQHIGAPSNPRTKPAVRERVVSKLVAGGCQRAGNLRVALHVRATLEKSSAHSFTCKQTCDFQTRRCGPIIERQRHRPSKTRSTRNRRRKHL